MRTIGWMVIGLCVLLCGVSTGFGEAVVIVSTGDASPDGNGTISYLDTPVLNDSGQVVLDVDLESTVGGLLDDAGIFLGTGGGLTQVVREGQAAPDANGTFSGPSAARLNDSGQVAFEAYLAGTSGAPNDNEGVFRGAGGPVVRVVRAGQACPDGNGVFNYFEDYDINNSGQVMVHAMLSNTSDNSGIFLESSGVVTRVVRKNQAVPDGNGVYSMLYDPALNDQGQVVFFANLAGTSGGSADNGGIFRGSGGLVTRIAREGQPAPDGIGTFSAFGLTYALNDSGRAAFVGYLDGTVGGASDNSGVFSGFGGALTQIARRGQLAPDGNGVFGDFAHPLINNVGQAVFRSYLLSSIGGTNDDVGIYRGLGGGCYADCPGRTTGSRWRRNS
jgi:hypothetical protein